MTRFGPKLDREQLLLSRFVGIATELFAISATCSFAQHKINSGEPAEEVFSVATYFCRSASMRIDAAFRRHRAKCGPARLRSDAGAVGGKHEDLRKGIV